MSLSFLIQSLLPIKKKILLIGWDPIKVAFWASWMFFSFFFFGLFGGGCIGLYTLSRFFGVSLYMKFSLLINFFFLKDFMHS